MVWVPDLPAEPGAKGAVLKDAKWPEGATISVSFLDGDPAVKKRVQKVAQTWTGPGMANLSFSFRDDTNDTQSRISFKYKGSWSILGRYCETIKDKTQPTMNYGWLTPASSDEELRRVVLHEFGHALGFIHEHQNPIDSIPWNRDAVIAELSGPPNNWTPKQIDINMFQQPTPEEVHGTEVDKKSIMMYPIPASWTQNGFSVGLNSELSQKDRALVKKVYPW